MKSKGLFEIDPNKIYIIPQQDKPVKIIYEDLPCPILSQLGSVHRCQYSQSKTEGMDYILYCLKDDCEIKITVKS